MADRCHISRADATWNPVTGCTPLSTGYQHCYAMAMARRLQVMGNPRYADGFSVTLHPDRRDLPLRWRMPRGICVNSMSSLFLPAGPYEFVRPVFETMSRCPHHIVRLLTKRARRMARLSRQLTRTPNIWAGVSVESQDYVCRLDCPRRVEAAVRFASFEPLLGPVRPNLDGFTGWWPGASPARGRVA